MTKDKLREKRKQAIESLNDIKAILGLDELYIDELEKENAALKKKNLDTQDAVTMQMYTNKANEWHKVTEKLPEHENLVCNQDGEPCWYDSETDQWLDVEGTRTKTIEWCDMPTKESE